MEKRKMITHEEKSLIMSKIGQGDSTIKGIAELHGIARCTIHSWMRKRRKEESNNFIELPVIENKEREADSNNKKKLSLQKASFEFNQFSFVVEGDVEATSLVKILQVLEVIC